MWALRCITKYFIEFRSSIRFRTRVYKVWEHHSHLTCTQGGWSDFHVPGTWLSNLPLFKWLPIRENKVSSCKHLGMRGVPEHGLVLYSYKGSKRTQTEKVDQLESVALILGPSIRWQISRTKQGPWTRHTKGWRGIPFKFVMRPEEVHFQRFLFKLAPWLGA